MGEFDNAFDEAVSELDSAIIGTFGIPVIFTIQGVQRPCSAVFDDVQVIQSIADGRVVNVRAQAFCKVTDIQGLSRHDAACIQGKAMYVLDIGQPDGDTVTVTLAQGKPGRPTPGIEEWS